MRVLALWEELHDTEENSVGMETNVFITPNSTCGVKRWRRDMSWIERKVSKGVGVCVRDEIVRQTEGERHTDKQTDRQSL